MINFYLTGAEEANGFQNIPARSLGGYMSSTFVKNGELDGLFGGISEFNKLNRRSELIMIVMKNVGLAKANFNIKVINPVGSYSVMSIAVVEPSKDTENNDIFESIPDRYTEPYYADFAGSSGFDIPLFKKDAIYGIWIKRVISQAALTPIPTADLNTAFENNTDLQSEDDVIIDINYD